MMKQSSMMKEMLIQYEILRSFTQRWYLKTDNILTRE